MAGPLVRRVGEKVLSLILEKTLVGDVFAFVLQKIAKTGLLADKCLQRGFFPVPIHYYYPIPDVGEMERRKIWDRVSDLPGITFEPGMYLQYVTELATEFAAECVWPNEPQGNPARFHLHNGCFSYGCAAAVHCILRRNKPKRVVEVGSGNSSKVIAAALALNVGEGVVARYSVIDPYTSIDQFGLPGEIEIIRQSVELMPFDYFADLGEGDVLFIDSSHVCKLGSDVNYEILELLPRLKPGVFVHFHDIALPYEYPKSYATRNRHRYFWTESYLLQAFLACNRDYETILPMEYLQKNHLDALSAAFPASTGTDFGWVSGSFWIRRVADSTSGR